MRIVGAANGQFSIALPADTALVIRLDAVSRLADTVMSANAYRPTLMQRLRLALLLRILDASADGLPKRAIAQEIVYPRIKVLHGAAWKASAERRRTLRLSTEAARLRDRGIFDLLHARLRPTG